MEQRTCNIIMCCKGHFKLVDENASRIDAIKAYMGRECAYPPENYTDRMIKGILKTALYDYFRVCDNPSFELRQLLDDSVWMENYTLSDRIVTMFELTQVRENGDYVNGFDEGLLRQSDIDLGVTGGD